MSPYFQAYTPAAIREKTAARSGELKIGQKARVPEGGDWMDALARTRCRFAWIGIPEDIGVRANGGIGGAHTAPDAALKALVNVQDTHSLPGSEILLLGAFDFSEWMAEAEGASVETLRELVERIDAEVAAVATAVMREGIVPIVIGGGHNNCYGLLEGASQARRRPVHALSLDAHSDFRALEGRHSGNGFRYARENGFLDAYAVVGLHENYNNPAILAQLTPDAGFYYALYEAIYLRQERTFDASVSAALAHVAEGATGVELDLDAIEGVLASASTPSGVSMAEARRYAWRAGREADALYLHLCEGVARRADGLENPMLGKTIAYLATDFMKGMLQRWRASGL